FKPAPYAQFRDTDVDRVEPNFLKIQIQPDEGMWFDLQAKKPGPTLDMQTIELGFAYKDFFEMQPSTGLSQANIDAVRQLRESGIHFTIASSRPPRAMRQQIEALGIDLPTVAFNGANIIRPDGSLLKAHR
nr:hypothetical protein [Tanacetum cinerariifolium]